MVNTTLSRNGYKIKKSELSQKELKTLKTDLTVNPYVVGDFGNGSEKRFSLYMESPNSIYIPRFYAYDKYGLPTENKMIEGKVTSIFDIEIQSAINQIQSSENAQNGEGSDYEDSEGYENIFSNETQEDSDQDLPIEEERDYQGLTTEDRKEVDRLKKRDAEVRAHEMAHLAAAGGLATGPYYEYQQGPDSKQYAVGGHVNIDTSPGNSPEETIMKAAKIRSAAMAPIEPSSQDRIVATEAARMEAAARAELAAEKIDEQEENTDSEISNPEDISSDNTSYFNPDAPMFTPTLSDTSHISSSGPSISIIPKKSAAEIYASGFSSIHPVEDVDEEDSNKNKDRDLNDKPIMSASDRVEQSRGIKGLEGYNKTKQGPEDIGTQSTKRYRV